jgi:hypothetical protein
MERTLCQSHSSCLWFQIFGVAAYSFFPDDQRDRCDLARYGQACHLRLYPFGDQRSVKLPEWSGLGSGYGRGTLEQIFEIVVMISIQLTN